MTEAGGTSRTRIKFCGMMRVVDVDMAADLGVDALGLIFAERSKRRLTIAQGRELRAAMPVFMASVALVMDNPLTQIREIVSIVRPALLQFHGDEAEVDCLAAGMPYLKALPMGEGDADTVAAIAGYPSAAGFVLDSHVAGAAGGSGECFDWSRWPSKTPRPLLLAGGLTPDNVYAAVRELRPFAVDVSSGIESAPGIKCPQRMAQFVAQVRRADRDADASSI
jgi:phosphoribosylanthranilate isomerase